MEDVSESAAQILDVSSTPQRCPRVGDPLKTENPNGTDSETTDVDARDWEARLEECRVDFNTSSQLLDDR